MRRKDCTVLDDRIRFRARLLEGRRWPPRGVSSMYPTARGGLTVMGTHCRCRVETDILTLKRDKCPDPVSLVEPGGFEPPTSSMPSRRAPNCATAPPELEVMKNCSILVTRGQTRNMQRIPRRSELRVRVSVNLNSSCSHLNGMNNPFATCLRKDYPPANHSRQRRFHNV
jgi:hypothetical protein